MVLGSLFYLSLNDDVEVKFVQDFEACFCKYVPLAKSFFFDVYLLLSAESGGPIV